MGVVSNPSFSLRAAAKVKSEYYLKQKSTKEKVFFSVSIW